MISYKIDIDSKDYERALKTMREKMPTVERKILSRLASEGISRIKKKMYEVFKTHKTMNLEGPMTSFRMINNTTTELFADIIYAAIQEWGGDIYPVIAKCLRFEIDGKLIFTRHVYIPGKHYFHPTLQDYLQSDEAKELMVRTLQEEIDKAVA